jgi:hypothetical protein
MNVPRDEPDGYQHDHNGNGDLDELVPFLDGGFSA